MGENTQIKEFYDYLRYAISMAQYSLPAIVIEDIRTHLSEYLDKLNNEELENILKTMELYEDYYLKNYNLVEGLKNSIKESSYSKEIFTIFSEQLGELSLKLERLDFIRDFIVSISDLIDDRLNPEDEVKIHA